MTFDEDVRDTLLAHADDAPSGAGTLGAVHRRERTLRVHYRIGTTGAAVAVATALAVTVPYALANRTHTTGSTPAGAGTVAASHPPPATTSTTSPATTPPHPTRVPLEPASSLTVRFPLTPTFVPSGLPAPTVGRNAGPDTRLVYSNADGSGLIATVGVHKPIVAFRSVSTTHITVHGHQATLYTASGAVEIVWRLGDGRWVSVTSSGSLTVDRVTQYANGLQETPMPAPALPFHVGKAPRGYQVAFQEIHPELSPEEFYFCLAAPNQLGDEGDSWMCVHHTADSGASIGGTPVQVGSDPGELVQDDSGVILAVHRPGFEFSVNESNTGPLSVPDLIAFAVAFTQQ